MSIHNRTLQYIVSVSESSPVLASLMLEQFGGPQGELAAAMCYLTQGLAEDDPGRKDMLLDIATVSSPPDLLKLAGRRCPANA